MPRNRLLPASYSLWLHPRSQRRIDNLRYQGIATTLGELARAHHGAGSSADDFGSLGLSIAGLENGGADTYDLKAIQAPSKLLLR